MCIAARKRKVAVLEERMSTRQAEVRLPDETHVRLKALAAKTGQTATFPMRVAIEEHLLDAKDLAAAEQALSEHRKSGDAPRLTNWTSRLALTVEVTPSAARQVGRLGRENAGCIGNFLRPCLSTLDDPCRSKRR